MPTSAFKAVLDSNTLVPWFEAAAFAAAVAFIATVAGIDGCAGGGIGLCALNNDPADEAKCECIEAIDAMEPGVHPYPARFNAEVRAALSCCNCSSEPASPAFFEGPSRS